MNIFKSLKIILLLKMFIFFCSATYKSWLKILIFFHLALLVLMTFRLSTSIFVMFGIRPPGFLQTFRLPVAQGWEYAWLCSGFAAVFAMLAIPRNRLFLLKQSCVGTLLFGLGPVLYAAVTLLDDMLEYYNSRETKILFLGFPVVVMWYMFLIVALQVHSFELYFMWKLFSAWKPKKKKVN